MHYHIILTERCNLRCSYCYGKSMKEFKNGLEEKWDYDMETPVDSEVEVKKIKKLIKEDDALIFYGGEPLIMMDKIKEIMDNVNCRFMIQTNGVLLDQLPAKYLNKMKKMLVSIDGDEERTDENRGKGRYKTVIGNIKKIRENGYKGEIVARMVITKGDLFDQIMHVVWLIKNGIYDSIHWQIDAEFYKFDFDKEGFSKFVEEYNESLEKLIKWWVEEIKKGRAWRIYPFLGVLGRVVGWDREKRLPCGSGFANFTINTKGDLTACPIMNSVKNMYCGDVDTGVKKEINCAGWCVGCDYFEVCGGRCLYSNSAQLWPREGHDLVCLTIKKLIDSLRGYSKEILELIDSGIVSLDDFEFEKYFGPEIIP